MLLAAAGPAPYASPAAPPYSPTPAAAPAPPPVDAEKQRLAASLFGGGAASPARPRRAAARPAASPPKPASHADLLGDMAPAEPAPAAQQQQQPAAAGLDMLLDMGAPAAAAPVDPLAALSGLDVPPAGSGGGGAPAAGGMDLLGGLGDLLGPPAGGPAAFAAQQLGGGLPGALCAWLRVCGLVLGGCVDAGHAKGHAAVWPGVQCMFVS